MAPPASAPASNASNSIAVPTPTPITETAKDVAINDGTNTTSIALTGNNPEITEEAVISVEIGFERIPDTLREYMQSHPGQYRAVVEVAEVRGSIPPLADGIFPSVFFLGEWPTPKLHLRLHIPVDNKGGQGPPPDFLADVFAEYSVQARIIEKSTGQVVYKTGGVKGRRQIEAEGVGTDGGPAITAAYEFIMPENPPKPSAEEAAMQQLAEDEEEVDPELLAEDE